MGSDTSSSLLLFIAAIAVAAIAGGAMAGVVSSMAGELRERGDGLADTLGTDLVIANDPDHVPYDGGADELTIYVKNTGSSTLVADDLLVLVDGQHASFTYTLLDGATRWSEGRVVQLTVSADLTAGDHTIRASYDSISDTMEFRV